MQHCENVQRSVQVVNLDPAAEHFDYQVLAGVCMLCMGHLLLKVLSRSLLLKIPCNFAKKELSRKCE